MTMESGPPRGERLRLDRFRGLLSGRPHGLRRLTKIVPLWVYPLLLALLLFDTRGVQTSPDSAWCLSLASNLYHGLGYVGPDWEPVTVRAPLFPALIAASFVFFGESVEHAVWGGPPRRGLSAD